MFRECKYFIKFTGQRLWLKKQKIFSFATLNTVSSRKPLTENFSRRQRFDFWNLKFPLTVSLLLYRYVRMLWQPWKLWLRGWNRCKHEEFLHSPLANSLILFFLCKPVLRWTNISSSVAAQSSQHHWGNVALIQEQQGHMTHSHAVRENDRRGHIVLMRGRVCKHAGVKSVSGGTQMKLQPFSGWIKKKEWFTRWFSHIQPSAE